MLFLLLVQIEQKSTQLLVTAPEKGHGVVTVEPMVHVKLIGRGGGVTNIKDRPGHDPRVRRGSELRTGVRFRLRFRWRGVPVGKTGSSADVGDQVDELAEREVQGGGKSKLAEDDVVLSCMRDREEDNQDQPQ